MSVRWAAGGRPFRSLLISLSALSITRHNTSYFGGSGGAYNGTLDSSGTPKTCAMRKANSRRGEYLSPSMGVTVLTRNQDTVGEFRCVIERAPRSSRRCC